MDRMDYEAEMNASPKSQGVGSVNCRVQNKRPRRLVSWSFSISVDRLFAERRCIKMLSESAVIRG